MDAADKGDLSQVNQCLQEGANINTIDIVSFRRIFEPKPNPHTIPTLLQP
jgi:hypothetical protein